MTAAGSKTARLCARIIAGASRVVPADVRRDWVREWHAELHHATIRLGRRGVPAPASRLRLVGRCGGACVHAAWLRWDRWRLDMLLQDIRHALRGLGHRPGFAFMTVLTLAIGIGANAAIFSAVRAVLLRPLPFAAPEQLVQLFSTTIRMPDRAAGTASPPDFVDWRRDNSSFTELAAVNAGTYALTGVGAAEQIAGANVTGGFFAVLGVPPLVGRALRPEDDGVGGPEVAVLGHGLWTRRLGGDPAAVGRTLTVDGVAVRIVGVMPRGFAYPLQSDIWLPLRFSERDLATQRGAHYLDVIGRLRPGVTLGQARDQMGAIAVRLAGAYPDTNRDSRIAVHEMRGAMVGEVRPALLMLLGAVGFVLLIVCVNVANLVLTRALGRSREMAIRGSLGAGRVRLVRGVLVESVLLAALGGAAGLLLATWASQGIAGLERALAIPLLDHTRVDGAVVAFTIGVSLLAAVLFGSLPAWQSSSITDLAARIREDSGNATGDRHRQRVRSVLIVAETALAVVLLVGAGLLLRSFLNMASVDLGFDAARVETFNVSLPDARYQQPAERAAFIDGLVTRVGQEPDVEAAAAISGLPLTNFRYTISMSTLDGRRLDNDEQMARSLQIRVVTPDYFRAMTVSMTRGRALTPADRAGAPLSVIVNQTAAAQLWPGENPLGHEFTLGTRLGQGGPSAGGTVVGVAADVRDYGPVTAVRPTVYLAHAQFPVSFVTVVARVRPGAVIRHDSLRRLLAGLDADVPMFRARSMAQLQADAVAQPRAYVLLFGLFAGTAVLLAAIGIYGVLTLVVTQRTREIGIRLALGAGRGQVVGMVVRHAGLLACAGLAIGLALAFGATRLIRGLLFGVDAADAPTYLAVAGGLLAVALLASCVPALRASRVDPVRALRYE